MKLYYSPGACSLSPHIVAKEAGLDLELVKVDLGSKTVREKGDYWKVNPKGYVPALELDDGQVLTEGPAIIQYLADQRPQSGLVPPAGSFERYRVLEMVAYVSSEIHKTFSPLFNPKTGDEQRQATVAYLKRRYEYLDKLLAGRSYLVGDHFSVADAYLFTVTSWAGYVKLDLSEFANLSAYQKRIAARPGVNAAMKAEGLVK